MRNRWLLFSRIRIGGEAGDFVNFIRAGPEYASGIEPGSPRAGCSFEQSGTEIQREEARLVCRDVAT